MSNLAGNKDVLKGQRGGGQGGSGGSCGSGAAKDAAPCSCIDLSAAVDPAGPTASGNAGVYRGPNLTFSQSNFHDNNNTPATSACPEDGAKINGLHRAFRWRPGKISEECAGNAAAAPVRSDDVVKRPRYDDGSDSEETRRCFLEGGAEFLATALLMFVGCAGAYIEMDKPSANVYGSAAFGFAVFMSTTIFGGVSGAHMNPLVTLVCLAFGKIPWSRAVVFMAAQTGGALLGYGLLYVVVPDDVQAAVQGQVRGGAVCCTVPLDSMSSWGAVLAEFVVTSILLAAVCAGLHPPPQQAPGPPPAFQFGVLVFGICTVEAMYTGASMNPARSIATAIWNGMWDRFWVYLVGQSFALAFVVGTYAVFRTRREDE